MLLKNAVNEGGDLEEQMAHKAVWSMWLGHSLGGVEAVRADGNCHLPWTNVEP